MARSRKTRDDARKSKPGPADREVEARDPQVETNHVPVLLDEVLAFAHETDARVIADGTLGEAGHTTALRRAFPGALMLARDRDPELIERARSRIEARGFFFHRLETRGDREQESENEGDAPRAMPGATLGPIASADAPGAHVAHERPAPPPALNVSRGPFSELGDQLVALELKADFILLDLGVSLHHFLGAGRGFSFEDEALDMRLDPLLPRTAADLVNRMPEHELTELLRRCGEEPRAAKVARFIVEARPVLEARRLAAIVERALGRGKPGRRGLHPATRTFQALRIAVNQELEELERALAHLPENLAPGGALAVISFHSLEDRLVKLRFRELGEKIRAPVSERRAAYANKAASDKDYALLTPRPVVPSEAEIRANPRARSAKLRVLQRKK